MKKNGAGKTIAVLKLKKKNGKRIENNFFRRWIEKVRNKTNILNLINEKLSLDLNSKSDNDFFSNFFIFSVACYRSFFRGTMPDHI